ncbi:MAG TPA: RDD family protein [Candidatus Acidoferrales bacterium]|jgi:uncharacterized RDD family membrane protein YckC|nr:RDD family protein [Candidatus Acidoferrales bacterium]
MYCSRCGKEVDEGSRFCQACGQEVGVAVDTMSSGAPSAAPLPFNSVAARPGNYVTPLYAGFWVRFVAYMIDGLILSIPFGILVIGVIFMLGGFGVLLHRTPVDLQGNPPIDPRAAMLMAAPMFVLFYTGMFFFVGLQWLYFAGMESSARQATFGKSAMALRVTNSEGERLSFGHATGRFFAKLVSGLVPLGIGYIMAGFTEKKQALHDFIAGTVVVRD